MSSSQVAYYLYCLTPCECDVKTSAAGVDGKHTVFGSAQEGLDAVLSTVELGEFCDDTAEARLQDLAWLAPRVCRHEAVIEEVMRQAPVLPARFETLFSSMESLKQSIHQHREAIAGFFAELADQEEWAVKGLLDRPAALRSSVSSFQPTAEGPAPGASPGARYFQEKRIKAQWERDFNHRLREFCQQAVAALAACATGFRERSLLAPGAAETEAEVVLNWAFLISPAALDDFRARLERLNGGEAFPGLKLTLTGPWPPYSFVPDLSDGAEA